MSQFLTSLGIETTHRTRKLATNLGNFMFFPMEEISSTKILNWLHLDHNFAEKSHILPCLHFSHEQIFN